jgi:hypothetical protein
MHASLFISVSSIESDLLPASQEFKVESRDITAKVEARRDLYS